jgi:DNA (cytosine-5)-methyltransferase 1
LHGLRGAAITKKAHHYCLRVSTLLSCCSPVCPLLAFQWVEADIVSRPGELLPPFPNPTHGLPGSGLFDYTTINQMIANIPPDAPDHDIEGSRSRGLRNGTRVPFDANRQAKTVTCSGGENNYHPSGTRGFTNREFACLQTFPLDYRFAREVRKQIGNAVPPALSKAIYREIIKSLQRTDEQEFRAGDS